MEISTFCFQHLIYYNVNTTESKHAEGEKNVRFEEETMIDLDLKKRTDFLLIAVENGCTEQQKMTF